VCVRGNKRGGRGGVKKKEGGIDQSVNCK
jgi:hypothetical protein